MTGFETRLFIDGAFVAGQGAVEIAWEPALGKPLAEVASASADKVDQAVEAAHHSYKDWSKRTPRERSAALRAIAAAIEARTATLAAIESRNAGKPVFGICRGLQEINVALGGTLRDLRIAGSGGVHHAPPGAALDDMFAFAHPVRVVPGSMLQRFTERENLEVNSVHFQAIDRLAKGLTVNATSADGIIEAVSATHTPAPVFAVQWHPEWRPQGRPHDLAFWHYLGEAARAHYLPAPGSELTP